MALIGQLKIVDLKMQKRTKNHTYSHVIQVPVVVMSQIFYILYLATL